MSWKRGLTEGQGLIKGSTNMEDMQKQTHRKKIFVLKNS